MQSTPKILLLSITYVISSNVEKSIPYYCFTDRFLRACGYAALSRNDKQGEVPPLPCSAKGVITFSHSFCGQHFLLLMSFRLSDRRERMEKSRLIQLVFRTGWVFGRYIKKSRYGLCFLVERKMSMSAPAASATITTAATAGLPSL